MAEEFVNGAEVGLGKVRVVKGNHGDAESAAGGEGFPGHLIRVAGFDDIGALAFEDFLDGIQIEQGTVAGGARDERGTDGVGAGEPVFAAFVFLPGDDEHVLIVRPGAAHPGDFSEM